MSEDPPPYGVDNWPPGRSVPPAAPTPATTPAPDYEAVRAICDSCIALVQAIPLADLERYVARVAFQHTVGPILDPTAYRRDMDVWTWTEQLGNAVLAFRREIDRITKEARRGR